MKSTFPYIHTSEFLSVNSLAWFLFAAALCLVDFATRIACFAHCQLTAGKYFGLRPFKNLYFAFSVPLPSILMYLLYGSVLAVLCTYVGTHWRALGFYSRLAWVLVFTGAVANVGERMVLGYVRDFIQIGTGYLNMADVYILLGVAYLLYANFIHGEQI